jgi:DNA-binding FrmR family transcriptional regulator
MVLDRFPPRRKICQAVPPRRLTERLGRQMGRNLSSRCFQILQFAVRHAVVSAASAVMAATLTTHFRAAEAKECSEGLATQTLVDKIGHYSCCV